MKTSLRYVYHISMVLCLIVGFLQTSRSDVGPDVIAQLASDNTEAIRQIYDRALLAAQEGNSVAAVIVHQALRMQGRDELIYFPNPKYSQLYPETINDWVKMAKQKAEAGDTFFVAVMERLCAEGINGEEALDASNLTIRVTNPAVIHASNSSLCDFVKCELKDIDKNTEPSAVRDFRYCQSNATQSQASMSPSNLVGSYTSVVWSDTQACLGKTVLTQDGTVLTGSYEFNDKNGLVKGNLTEFRLLNGRTVVCKWQDQFGTGDLSVEFAPDLKSFHGSWSGSGSQYKLPWNGKR
ncbi:MAG: hypothetical protein KKD33_00250 [Verrucomicrobia bacterium]|nr:hypothetical protein [Verrucomicrobiota bacterium]